MTPIPSSLRAAVALAGLTLLSACGGGAAPRAEGAAEPATYHEATAPGGEQMLEPEPATPGLTTEDQRLLDEFGPRLEDLEAQYLSSFQASGAPDCVRAAELRDRICDLAERVCDIAERHPTRQDVTEKCESGRERCDRAAREVAETCGSP